MRLHLTINWKLFHTADSQPVGQMVAAVKPEGVQVQWTDFRPSGADMLLPDLSRMLDVVRHHVGEYLRDATLVVVPLRIGGGTRLKIFEAMAMGKAVVSTTIGAEGLDVESGRDLILADDATTLAHAITLLLRDPALRRRYEEAAAKLAAQYDWSNIEQRFAEVLLRVSRGTAQSGRSHDPRAARQP